MAKIEQSDSTTESIETHDARCEEPAPAKVQALPSREYWGRVHSIWRWASRCERKSKRGNPKARTAKSDEINWPWPENDSCGSQWKDCKGLNPRENCGRVAIAVGL